MKFLPEILFKGSSSDIMVLPEAINFIEGDFSAQENPKKTFEVTIPKSFNPKNDFVLFDDFMFFKYVSGFPGGYFFGRYNWDVVYFFSNTGTITQDTYGLTANNPGTIRITSPSLNTGSTYITLSNSGSILGTTPNFHFISAVASPNASTTSKRSIIGTFNTIDISDNPVTGIYFQATNTGNWQAITKNSSTTTTDTGIAQSTAFKRFEFLLNSAGTSVGFYIDGVLVATHITNIPTTGQVPVFHTKTTASGIKSLDIDYVYVKTSLMTR